MASVNSLSNILETLSRLTIGSVFAMPTRMLDFGAGVQYFVRSQRAKGEVMAKESGDDEICDDSGGERGPIADSVRQIAISLFKKKHPTCAGPPPRLRRYKAGDSLSAQCSRCYINIELRGIEIAARACIPCTEDVSVSQECKKSVCTKDRSVGHIYCLGHSIEFKKSCLSENDFNSAPECEDDVCGNHPKIDDVFCGYHRRQIEIHHCGCGDRLIHEADSGRWRCFKCWPLGQSPATTDLQSPGQRITAETCLFPGCYGESVEYDDPIVKSIYCSGHAFCGGMPTEQVFDLSDRMNADTSCSDCVPGIRICEGHLKLWLAVRRKGNRRSCSWDMGLGQCDIAIDDDQELCTRHRMGMSVLVDANEKCIDEVLHGAAKVFCERKGCDARRPIGQRFCQPCEKVWTCITGGVDYFSDEPDKKPPMHRWVPDALGEKDVCSVKIEGVDGFGRKLVEPHRTRPGSAVFAPSRPRDGAGPIFTEKCKADGCDDIEVDGGYCYDCNRVGNVCKYPIGGEKCLIVISSRAEYCQHHEIDAAEVQKRKLKAERFVGDTGAPEPDWDDGMPINLKDWVNCEASVVPGKEFNGRNAPDFVEGKCGIRIKPGRSIDRKRCQLHKEKSLDDLKFDLLMREKYTGIFEIEGSRTRYLIRGEEITAEEFNRRVAEYEEDIGEPGEPELFCAKCNAPIDKLGNYFQDVVGIGNLCQECAKEHQNV